MIRSNSFRKSEDSHYNSACSFTAFAQTTHKRPVAAFGARRVLWPPRVQELRGVPARPGSPRGPSAAQSPAAARSGISCITDLMVKEGLVNLDFADVCVIMSEMGTATIGTGEATGERRALHAAEAAIANPLLRDTSMKGARGLLISITGGDDLTLHDVDEAASRIRQEVDEEANIIVGATFEPALDEAVRVSVVATGIDQVANFQTKQMSA